MICDALRSLVYNCNPNVSFAKALERTTMRFRVRPLWKTASIVAIVAAALTAMAQTTGDADPAPAIVPGALGNVFSAADPVFVSVRATAPVIAWTLTDFWGRTIAQGNASSSNGLARIDLPLAGRPGYYSLALATGPVDAPPAATTSLAVLPPFQGESAAESPFGVMTHFAQNWPTDIMPLLEKAGVANVRDEAYWDHIESQPGQFVFPANFEAYMAGLKQVHVTPMVPLDFENRNYDGGNTPYTQEGVDAYARYCRQALAHYGDQIKTVEIWNEYNGSFAKGPATADRPDTYVKMLKAAYTAIKADRPDVVVLGCSTSGTPLPYLERVFKAGGLKYMDAVSVHPYRYEKAPEGLERQIERVETLIEKYNGGQPKPIWVTEIGWYVKTKLTPGEMPVTEADQAKFVVRSYALLFSAGVAKAYWYLFRDYGPFATMGLVRSPDDPQGRYAIKPSYVALATMIRQLAGMKCVKSEATTDGVYSVLFARTGAPDVRVMWAAPTTRRIVVDAAGSLSVTDMMGARTEVAAHAGKVGLDLTDAPVYVQGPVRALPAPDLGAKNAILADSSDDFSQTQGDGNWYYGTFENEAPQGAYDPAAFAPLPNYVATEWDDQWSGPLQFLKISQSGQHPGVDNGHPVWAVRRWASPIAGAIEISGSFVRGTGGDGSGVHVFVDGHPLFGALLGGGNSIRGQFDVKALVNKGSKVDFTVDPGPAANIEFDATEVNAVIKKAISR